MTNRKCRRCRKPLSTDNARRFDGRWVGACRSCEYAEAQERRDARRWRSTCDCGHSHWHKVEPAAEPTVAALTGARA
jgi:hypothetical protein